MTIKYIDHSLINSEKDYWEAENDLQKKNVRPYDSVCR